MRDVFYKVRGLCVIATAAGLVLGTTPVRADNSTGLGPFTGPITSWLARAPASCVLNSYLKRGREFPDSNHVAYWVGHALDDDEAEVVKLLRWPADWHGILAGGTEGVAAVYDPLVHVAAFNIGHQDMNEWGALADEPNPPASAPGMRADLSRLTLGGNVHLGDSLASVRSALGLHALAPTETPRCPGFGVVELCDWNVARCACPPTMFYQGSHDISGTIIFRYGRVVGLFWNKKCWAAG